MKDTVTLKYFMSQYNKYSGADSVIFGFEYQGNVYTYSAKHLPMSILTTAREASSKGGYFKVRIKALSTKDINKLLKSKNTTFLMTLVELDAIETKANTNRGHKLEKFLAMKHKAENPNWKEGGIDRFDKCGDVIIDGKQVQVKFGAASLTNLNTLHNVQKEHRNKNK